jgi:hypothetical protein
MGDPQATLLFFYMKDTFVIWPHGPDNLNIILYHLNSVHENIDFTIQTERDGHIPFLDIEICHKQDGLLGHRVFTLTLTSTQFQLMRPPLQKKEALLSALVHRARALSDKASLHDELAVVSQGHFQAEWLHKSAVLIGSQFTDESPQPWRNPSRSTSLPLSAQPLITTAE